MLTLFVALASLGAAAQAPPAELPVSLERIREELKQPPAIDANRPLEQPVATFRIRIEHPRYVPTIEEWIRREFRLSALQRQSAAWGSKCCGLNLLSLASGLTKGIKEARQRREVRKIREQIARELAELEAARQARKK
jgi:hypothetical protein